MVYDVTKRSSFDNLVRWLEEMKAIYDGFLRALASEGYDQRRSGAKRK